MRPGDYCPKNYGARREIVLAAQKYAQDVKNGKVDELSEELFDSYMMTAKLPPVDLMIRTSGEKRLSNFLTWQSTYAELYFPEIFWPEFDENQMDKAIEEYIKRNRRFGGN